jgi:hypothetical protein
MNTTGALNFGHPVTVVNTPVLGRQLNLVGAATNHRFVTSGASEPGDGQSRPPSNIGGLPVPVDGTVEPPFNAAANRNRRRSRYGGQLSSRQ